MGIDFLILMKQEWTVIAILFILLFIKVGNREWKNENILSLVNTFVTDQFYLRIFLEPGRHTCSTKCSKQIRSSLRKKIF